MLNQDIRRTALYIFKNTAVPATIVAAINTGIPYLFFEVIERLLNGQYVLLMLPRAIAVIVWSILTNYFSMRSWILGKCRFEYLAEPFKNRNLKKRFVPLSAAITVIYLLLAIPAVILLVVFVLGRLATITDYGFDIDKVVIIGYAYILIVGIVMMCITFAVYIFATGAQYSTAGMLKRGFVYLARNWAGWLWFGMTVEFVPALIWAVLKMAFNSNPAIIILYLPVKGYIMVAKAGYVYENILRMEFSNEATYSYAATAMAEEIK